MESPLSRLRMHRDHEPERSGVSAERRCLGVSKLERQPPQGVRLVAMM